MDSADIVIIGGGIVGVCIAYQLAVRDQHKVVILERDTIASGSIGRAMGGIRQQFADERDILCSQEGVRFYMQFLREHENQPSIPLHATPPRFHQHGYLFLATTAESWLSLQRHVNLQRSFGVETQLLSGQEVKQRIPQLHVDDIFGGSLCLTDGYTDPGAMTQALAFQGAKRGVRIIEHAPVIDILVERNKVKAVKTTRATIQAPIVINAAGVYSPSIAQLAGLPDLPVRPLRRQLLLTEPYNDLPEDMPMIVELISGFHFRRRDGRVVFALPLPPSAEEAQRNQAMAAEAFHTEITHSLWPQVQELTHHRYPALAEVKLAHEWAGLYEMTPDEQPILGVTEIDGFLCACGFSGHGFMHAPMAARLLTELLINGRSSSLDIAQFSYRRFRTGALLKTTRLL